MSLPPKGVLPMGKINLKLYDSNESTGHRVENSGVWRGKQSDKTRSRLRIKKKNT